MTGERVSLYQGLLEVRGFYSRLSVSNFMFRVIIRRRSLMFYRLYIRDVSDFPARWETLDHQGRRYRAFVVVTTIVSIHGCFLYQQGYPGTNGIVGVAGDKVNSS